MIHKYIIFDRGPRAISLRCQLVVLEVSSSWHQSEQLDLVLTRDFNSRAAALAYRRRKFPLADVIIIDNDKKVMSAGTAIALEKSIKHWEDNVAAKDFNEVSIAGVDCALCAKFYDGWEHGSQCRKCPVFQKTGAPNCEKSPYVNVAEIYRSSYSYGQVSAQFTRAAKKQLNFLKSLREST